MAGTIVASTLSDGTNSTSTTNCIQGSAKAWVNFNGTGTVAIRASYNVSSITDNGTGDYTINFTNALPDANYCIVTNGGGPNVSSGTTTAGTVFQINAISSSPFFQAQTTTSCRIISITNIASYTSTVDCGFANVAIFD